MRGLAIVFGVCLLGLLLSKLSGEPQDYGDWLAEHRETCPRCCNRESSLCDGAFIKLQIELRQYRDVPQIDLARATRLWGIEEERREVAREFQFTRESETRP